MPLVIIDRLLLAHPRSANQGYFEHMKFAWRFAFTLFKAAAAAFIHGLLPNLFCTSASMTIRRLHGELEGRHSKIDPGF
jgi:Family of unknown function (DUF6356)